MIDIMGMQVQIITILLFIINILIGWGLWSLRAQFTSKDAHSHLTGRVGMLEDHVKRLPDTAAVHNLVIQMTRLEGELKSANTRFEGFENLSKMMGRQLNLVEEYLRRGGH